MKTSARVIWTVIGMVGLLAAGCVPGTASVGGTTATAQPTTTSAPTAIPTKAPATPVPQVGRVTFTVLFDNYAHDPDLETEWGFACLVETEGKCLLFDTGSDGAMLLRNMAALGKDPTKIDIVVLSHNHGDHTAGLEALLDTGVKPSLYVPPSFSTLFKDAFKSRTDLVVVTEPIEIFPGFWSTDYVGGPIAEQALAVQTSEGWVVVTGCAHPGVVGMVERAKEATGGEIALVMGGFHLSGSSRGRIDSIVEKLRGLGVKKVGPSHCTGDTPRAWFAEALGEDCISIGVGSVIVIEP